MRSQPIMARHETLTPPASLLYPQVAICSTIPPVGGSGQKQLIECSQQQLSSTTTTLVVPRSTLTSLTANEMNEKPDSTKWINKSKEE